MIDYRGASGDSTDLSQVLVHGWLCKEAVKVCIKVTVRSVPWAHDRKAIAT